MQCLKSCWRIFRWTWTQHPDRRIIREFFLPAVMLTESKPLSRKVEWLQLVQGPSVCKTDAHIIHAPVNRHHMREADDAGAFRHRLS